MTYDTSNFETFEYLDSDLRTIVSLVFKYMVYVLITSSGFLHLMQNTFWLVTSQI